MCSHCIEFGYYLCMVYSVKSISDNMHDTYYVYLSLSGFTGEHCEVNVNECLLFPCKNNATCEDLTAGYVCHCMSGWTGPTCAINIDDCENNSCLNGALCVDLVNR